MTEMIPTLVVFDLDDTLYEFQPCDEAGRIGLAALVSSRFGEIGERFDDAFSRARLLVKGRLGETASSHSRLLYCHEALELLGLRSEPRMALEMEQAYWRSYLAVAELRPGALDLIDTLRYNSVPIAIVTDLTTQIQFRKLVYLDIEQYFDHVVCSEETRNDKSSLEPFELLASRVGAAALECVWFIGDRATDAPIEELIERGTIKSGLGFVSEHLTPGSQHVRHWDRLSDIERQVTERFGTVV